MNRHSFAELIAERAELYLIQTPENYDINYALIGRHSGDVTAWLEVICYSQSPQNEFLINLDTWMTGIRLTNETDKPFLLGVRWDEMDYLLQIQSGYIPMVLLDLPITEDKACVRIPQSFFQRVPA